MMPFLESVREVWIRPDYLQREQNDRPPRRPDGLSRNVGFRRPTLGHYDSGARMRRVRWALSDSQDRACWMLAERLSGINLSMVLGALISACEDVAVIWGGSALLGGTIGGGIGIAVGGIGVAPGAVLGAGMGAQVGLWILGFLGLKSLIEDLGTAVPEVLRLYEAGFRTAWGRLDDGGTFLPSDGDDFSRISRAAHSFAQGHMLLMATMLTALLACLSRGRGDPAAKARILQEIRESKRLGPKVADWVAANEEALARHPGLKPKEQQVVMAAAPAKDVGPPITPAELRRLRDEGAPSAPNAADAQKKPELLPLHPPKTNAQGSLSSHPNHVGELPFSYKAAPFGRFVRRFKDEFSSARYDDAQGFMQGSAASGVKHSGEVLDARIPILPSDYDVAVVSPKLLQRANDLGLDVLHGPLNSTDLAALGLSDAQAALSAASKYERPVNFKIYDSVESAYNSDKTIPFSDWVK